VGQGGSGKPPPLAGLLLQVGSLWHVSVTCISLPASQKKAGECGIAMHNLPKSHVYYFELMQ